MVHLLKCRLGLYKDQVWVKILTWLEFYLNNKKYFINLNLIIKYIQYQLKYIFYILLIFNSEMGFLDVSTRLDPWTALLSTPLLSNFHHSLTPNKCHKSQFKACDHHTKNVPWRSIYKIGLIWPMRAVLIRRTSDDAYLLEALVTKWGNHEKLGYLGK